MPKIGKSGLWDGILGGKSADLLTGIVNLPTRPDHKIGQTITQDIERIFAKLLPVMAIGDFRQDQHIDPVSQSPTAKIKVAAAAGHIGCNAKLGLAFGQKVLKHGGDGIDLIKLGLMTGIGGAFPDRWRKGEIFGLEQLRMFDGKAQIQQIGDDVFFNRTAIMIARNVKFPGALAPAITAKPISRSSLLAKWP